MTIFRFSAAAIAVCSIPACSDPAVPLAKDCPDLSLPYEITRHVNGELTNTGALSTCFTEQAVKLASSQSASDQIAKAVIVACQPQFGMFEINAEIEAFGKDYRTTDAAKAAIREAAERFASARVIQVQSGQCTKP